MFFFEIIFQLSSKFNFFPHQFPFPLSVQCPVECNDSKEGNKYFEQNNNSRYIVP